MSDLENLVRLRMETTGETYDVALAAVRKIQQETEADRDQSWVPEWTDPVLWDDNPEANTWLRSRPKAIWPLLVRFPPSCVVRPLRPLHVPAWGTFGIVASYHEDGTIGVLQKPDGRVLAQCPLDAIEPVFWWRGWTPHRVREVLGLDKAS